VTSFGKSICKSKIEDTHADDGEPDAVEYLALVVEVEFLLQYRSEHHKQEQHQRQDGADPKDEFLARSALVPSQFYDLNYNCCCGLGLAATIIS